MATSGEPTTAATSANSADEATHERKLGDIFEEAYNLYNGLNDQLDRPQNSPEFQLELRKCTGLLEDATRLVSAVGLFSDNELEDEIATAHIKYLLLPYFLGQLVQKKTAGSGGVGGGPDRKEIVAVAQVYFKDFLARCESYSLHQGADKTVATFTAAAGAGQQDKMAELAQMAHQRNAKLQQYRAKKELDDDIKKMKILMEREHIDDGLRREFYLKLVRASCLEAVDELRSLAQETQMLDMMGDGRSRAMDDDDAGATAVAVPCGRHGHQHHRKPSAPLRPVIITKDAFQKAVYGAGYPSVATMSVDDFYENRVAAGIFPDPTVRRDPNSEQARAARGETAELEEEQDIQKEEDEQNDDEMYLARARAMDEFKDDVRRGDGNRHNRS